MNRFASLTLCFALFASCAVLAAGPAPKPANKPNDQMQKESLYKRLGGYDALAAVTDDFLGAMAADKRLGRFFVGLSKSSQERVRQHVIDFLCVNTGGPCKYTGRDMVTAHTGLNITEEDWEQAVKLLTATLDKFKVPAAEKAETLGAVSGLKNSIVGK
jgi:hemoglobin